MIKSIRLSLILAVVFVIMARYHASPEAPISQKLERLHEGFFGDTAQFRSKLIHQRIIEHNQFIKSRKIKIHKLKKMSSSVYNFYRATNHIFCADIQTGLINLPKGWDSKELSSWIVGDLHLGNVSYLKNTKSEDNISTQYFIDDYDEAMILPITLDLFRLLVSIELMSDELGFRIGKLKRLELYEAALQKYRQTIQESPSNVPKAYQGKLKSSKPQIQIQESESRQKLLKKWTYARKGRRMFQTNNKSLAKVDASISKILRDKWSLLLRELSATDSRELKIMDMRYRLRSGLGSLGVEKIYLLVSGPSASLKDDRIIELKEQRDSSYSSNNPTLMSIFKNTYPTNKALRNLKAQVAMRGGLSRFENHIQIGSKYYLIKELSPDERGIRPDVFKSKDDFERVIIMTADLIAKYHLRARNNLYFSTTKFRRHVEKYLSATIPDLVAKSVEYAEQVKLDHHLFDSKLDKILNDANW